MLHVSIKKRNIYWTVCKSGREKYKIKLWKRNLPIHVKNISAADVTVDHDTKRHVTSYKEWLLLPPLRWPWCCWTRTTGSTSSTPSGPTSPPPRSSSQSVRWTLPVAALCSVHWLSWRARAPTCATTPFSLRPSLTWPASRG